MTWVRFHGELRQGEKRGLSRATRFVYLELSHEARPRQGVVVLPQRMGDVDAVHEVLAGNRKEIVEAIRDLTAGPDPMIRFEEREGKRVLVVINWEKWNPKRDDSGPRVQRYRDKKKGDGESPEPSDGNALHNANETHGNATHIPRARALISSPLLSSGSDLEREEPEKGALRPADPHERYIQPGDKITAELRSTAQLTTVQDIDAAWLKFCGTRAGKWLHVQGAWQAWCVSWAEREKAARDQRRAQDATGGPIGDGPRAREDRRAREANRRHAEANAVPIPIGALVAVGAAAPAPPATGTRLRAAAKVSDELPALPRAELTDAEREARRQEQIAKARELEAREPKVDVK